MVYLTQRKSKIKGYVRYVHSNKKKWIPRKQIVQSIDLLLFFFRPIRFYSNGFLFIHIRFSKRKLKILYFCNPIALLTLE